MSGDDIDWTLKAFYLIAPHHAEQPYAAQGLSTDPHIENTENLPCMNKKPVSKIF